MVFVEKAFAYVTNVNTLADEFWRADLRLAESHEVLGSHVDRRDRVRRHE